MNQKVYDEKEDGPSQLKEETNTYFLRWIILSIFCLNGFLNTFNWIEFGIIQDVTIAFYNQSLPENEDAKAVAVNWLSIVYMLAYLPLGIPTMFLLDRKGLRISSIIGSFLNMIGSLIKCFAVRPDFFLVLILGQVFCSFSSVIFSNMPAKLSALWFDNTQISLATAICVSGFQVGVAVGFLVPPYLVTMGTIDEMKTSFYFLVIPIAVLSLIGLVLTLIFVKDEPELPPSLAQLESRNINKINSDSSNKFNDFLLFKNSMISLFKNVNFILMLISYGINVGAFYAISTLLNQIMSEYYENENQNIGNIGLILVVAGLIGSIIAGLILDKYKKFKLVTLIFFIGSLISMALFTSFLRTNIYVNFLTGFLLGFFMTGYLPIGFELVLEVTYPEPEGTSCGLLSLSAQIFGIILTYSQGSIATKYGGQWSSVYVCIFLFVGSKITALVRSDLRRQKTLKLPSTEKATFDYGTFQYCFQ